MKRKLRQKQTWAQSLSEQFVGQIATLLWAIVTAELFVYEMFGMDVSTTQNVGFMLYFFIQNIAIRYYLRRYYENRGI